MATMIDAILPGVTPPAPPGSEKPIESMYSTFEPAIPGVLASATPVADAHEFLANAYPTQDVRLTESTEEKWVWNPETGRYDHICCLTGSINIPDILGAQVCVRVMTDIEE